MEWPDYFKQELELALFAWTGRSTISLMKICTGLATDPQVESGVMVPVKMAGNLLTDLPSILLGAIADLGLVITADPGTLTSTCLLPMLWLSDASNFLLAVGYLRATSALDCICIGLMLRFQHLVEPQNRSCDQTLAI